jgi:hypothetical protein
LRFQQSHICTVYDKSKIESNKNHLCLTAVLKYRKSNEQGAQKYSILTRRREEKKYNLPGWNVADLLQGKVEWFRLISPPPEYQYITVNIL